MCVVQWLVAREDYHRLLKRVYMNGTYGNYPFETYIEYVNFRPYISSYALLDLCSIAPKVPLLTLTAPAASHQSEKEAQLAIGAQRAKKPGNGINLSAVQSC